MTLKAFYEKEADIPEALKSEYLQKDGKGNWVLDAEGMVSNDEIVNLRSKIDEFRSNNVDLTSKLAKFDGKKVFTQEDVEEFDRLVQQETDIKDKKLIDSGKIDELLANRTEKLRADYEAKIESLETSLTDAKEIGTKHERRLSSVLVRADVTQVLSDQGISPVKGAIADVFDRAGKVWKVNKEGVLEALNEKGEPVYGAEAKALTMVEWAAQTVKAAPFLFTKNDGTGGGGGTGIKPSDSDGIRKIPRSDERMKSKYIDDLADGKAVLVDG
jgi:hypothetical protein